MQRILLKLSGEALAGDKKTGFDEATVREVALQVKQLVDQGIQVGIVTGGGNFWRGRTSENIDNLTQLVKVIVGLKVPATLFTKTLTISTVSILNTF